MKYNSFSIIPCRGSTNHPTLLLLLFVMIFRSVICSYIAHTCDNSSSFTDGSTYSINLNLVINDLLRNASQSSGFNTSSHGQSPNKVYGLLQCTGNISAARCSNCVAEANRSIQERCPNDIGGLIWLEDCFMRYQNSIIPCRGSTNHPTFLLLLFVMIFRSVICSYIAHTCDNSSSFTDGSTYSINLNLVINDLLRNASQSSGFNTSSHG